MKISLAEWDGMDMGAFMKTCGVLAEENTPEAYRSLKEALSLEDPYKRRYALEKLYTFAEAKDGLLEELLSALASNTPHLFSAAVQLIIKYDIDVPEVRLRDALTRLGANDNYSCVGLLSRLKRNEDNFRWILGFYRERAGQTSMEIAIAEQIPSFCTEEGFAEAYELLRRGTEPHIRKAALLLAKRFERTALLRTFLTDENGHIRRCAGKALK